MWILKLYFWTFLAVFWQQVVCILNFLSEIENGASICLCLFFKVYFKSVFLDLSRRVFSSRLGVSSISYLKLKMWQVLFVAQTHKPELWKFKLETNSLKNCVFIITMQLPLRQMFQIYLFTN